ncbi:MAG: sigma-70 family RNA polymerase sigma factor [Oscillospiraceae bacterium]|nr:sigma-70 family RNA polymerase sigma factor [Oscillospiraceae bacterium]
MTRREEQQLIKAVLAGDPEPFEALVKANETMVYNLALHMLSDPQDALDASQEAFFRAWRALTSFRGDSRFSVWLYRLTSNVCLDMLRARARQAHDTLTDEDGRELPLADDRSSPEKSLERSERRQAIRDGLAQLEPGFRQALVLRELGGLSYEEIGQVTDLEPGTVKSRIFRARRKLAAILTAEGNIFGPEPSYEKDDQSRKGGAGNV